MTNTAVRGKISEIRKNLQETDGKMDLSFYKNRKVLVTGHSGFKGSWLSKLLISAGAEVYGFSLDVPTDPALFYLAGIREELGERSVNGDIRDFEALFGVFSEIRPEIVLHLAAQPIVRRSYEEPLLTYETNVMGTVNLMECVRRTDSVRSVVNVTTDKVYENRELKEAFREDERLDGYEPYANSKSCSELVTASYRRSYFAESGVAVSTARAGNVIGGGDYARDRILPDCVRAAEKGEPIVLRNPASVRPYQHVLEPLAVYLKIAEAQYRDPGLAGAYNVGPDREDCLTTGEIAALFCRYYGEGMRTEVRSDNGPHEAGFLSLDNRKIREVFSWRPVWRTEEAVRRTVAFAKAADKKAYMEQEIGEFLNAAAF